MKAAEALVDYSLANSDAVITCVYAAEGRLERVILQSLAATDREFADAPRFAGIDRSTPAIDAYLKGHGWILVYPTSRRAPRMKELLERCVKLCGRRYLWTIEHDCMIMPGARRAALLALSRHAGAGAVECMSLNVGGQPTVPCSTKRLSPWPAEPGLFEVRPYGSLNCVAWRGDALRGIDWGQVREFPHTDRSVYAEVVATGLSYLLTKDGTCRHLHGYARRALNDEKAKRPRRADPADAPAVQDTPVSAAPEATGPAEKSLFLGVILPVRNEGKDAVMTVRNMRKAIRPGSMLRFAVLDDASGDGCCNIFAGARDIVMERHPQPRGEAYNRNRGMELLPDCDCHIVFDAHMTCDTPAGLNRLAEAAIATKGICCGTTWNLAAGTDRPRYGGRLYWWPEGHGKNPAGLRAGWNYAQTGTLQPVQCIYGASYAMTFETWRKVGGWTDSQGLYGFGEPAMALRAWFLDIPMYCLTDVHFKHRFRVNRPYQMTGKWYWYNFVWCTKQVFSDAVFREVFLPVARKWMKGDARIEELAESAEAARLRDEFAPTKKHTDEECLQWLQIPTGALTT